MGVGGIVLSLVVWLLCHRRWGSIVGGGVALSLVVKSWRRWDCDVVGGVVALLSVELRCRRWGRVGVGGIALSLAVWLRCCWWG